jgi:abortive infection bacteriophage resistance protein
MTFGAVAKMSWYLNEPELSKSAAQSLGLQTTGFSSGLHTFSVLRNKCAHHSQLWNRTFDVLVAALPKEKKREPKHKSPGPYSTIIVAKRWLNALIGDNDWADRVDALLSTNTVYQQGILNPTMK